MRFVTFLGLWFIGARLGPVQPGAVDLVLTILIIAAVFDVTDFIMNIIKTFRKK